MKHDKDIEKKRFFPVDGRMFELNLVNVDYIGTISIELLAKKILFTLKDSTTAMIECNTEKDFKKELKFLTNLIKILR